MNTVCPGTDPLRSIALGAVVTASSTYPGYAASHIVDGNRSTVQSTAVSWTNNQNVAGPHTVEIDWGTAKDFGRVDLYTSDGYELADFDIEYWKGASWAPLAQVRGNTANKVVSVFATVNGSKLRVVGLTGPVSQPQYMRINEVDVFANIARTATATAKSTFGTYSVLKAHDGNRSTLLGDTASWVNASSPPDWLELAWPTCVGFDRADLFTTLAYEIKDYDVEAWDGTGWVKLDTVRGNVSTFHTSTFPLYRSTKLRIFTLAGPTSQAFYTRINELEVYGSTVGAL